MTDDKKKREARISLVVDIEKLDHVQGNDFFMITSATLAKGDRPLSNQQIKIFIDGVESEPLITDQEHGRVLYEVEFSTISKSVSVEARQTGFNTRSPRITRILPWPERKKENEKSAEAAEFIVDPTRIGNKITLLARVVDENGKDMKDVQLTLIENSRVEHPKTDEYGKFLYSFELSPSEEKEITIYANGFFEEFRRTFKGRSV